MIHLSLDSLKEQNEQTHRYSSEWLEGFKSHGIHGMISTFPQFSGIEAEGENWLIFFNCPNLADERHKLYIRFIDNDDACWYHKFRDDQEFFQFLKLFEFNHINPNINAKPDA